jgi:hypothetical protein
MRFIALGWVFPKLLGEGDMLTSKKTFAVWAAMVLATATSLADETDTQSNEPARYSTARQSRSGPQRVTIWRGGKPTLAAVQLKQDDPSLAAPMPPNAPGGYDPGPVGPMTDTESPFVDEPRGAWDDGNGFGAGGGGCASGGCDAAYNGGCEGGCGGECATCAGPCMCTPWWAHRTGLFGQYLYLHPTGIDMAHAIQQNGVGGAGTTPEGRVGVVHQDYTSAFRAGFVVALGPCASVEAAYTRFEAHNADSISAPDVLGGTVASLVLHPQSVNAGSTSSLVDATNDIDFELVDVDYRRMFAGGCRFKLDYSVGARYAKLSQNFLQVGEFAPPTGTIQTTTDIAFEGGGLRTGLDGMQRLGGSCFGLYGKGFISLIFGRFNSDYNQFDLTTQSVQAASNWRDQRVVPILEYEVGVNWTSPGGHWRSSIGYYTAFWFNTIATPEYVQAVQNADFVDLGETIAFDGLVTRLEFRY